MRDQPPRGTKDYGSGAQGRAGPESQPGTSIPSHPTIQPHDQSGLPGICRTVVSTPCPPCPALHPPPNWLLSPNDVLITTKQKATVGGAAAL